MFMMRSTWNNSFLNCGCTWKWRMIIAVNFNCLNWKIGLNWKIYCDDHSSLSSTTPGQKWIISYTSHHFTPHWRYELNKLTSLPMCGFIAQLVEQRTGNAEVTGSNPVEALIFFRLLLSNCLNWKIYCDDHSSLSCCFCYVMLCYINMLCYVNVI